MAILVGRICNAVNGAGASILVVMMLLTVVDVFGRYFLNRPVLGAYELTQFMVVIVVFFGMAYTAMKRGHVSLDLLLEKFPNRVRGFIETITNILSLSLFALIAWQSVLQANILRLKGEVSESLLVPVYPLLWIIAFGSVLLCVVILLDIRASLVKMAAGGRSWVLPGFGLVLVLFIFAAPLWGQVLPWQISPPVIGLLSLAVLIILFFFGMPIGFAMGVVGFLGMIYLIGPDSGIAPLRTSPYSSTASYTMSVIPLFILMGMFAFHSGLSADLYNTAYRWLGHLPGGLAMASVGSCAAFAAVSGSGIATAATMGTIALPEMRKYHYDDRLATGSIAAGGTIGILIPPSVVLIIYAILTEQSIGRLFAAGFLPGILEAVFYMATIFIICKRNPLMGPPGPSTTLREKLVSLKNGWQVLFLFALVMGGLYGGIFTPTEAAGIGAFGAFIFALIKRRLNRTNFWNSLIESGKTTSMTFVILIAAMILSYLLAVTRLPHELADWVAVLPLNRYIILGLIILIYLILGCFMSTMGMVILTVPIFFPVILALGFDPIWFGIIIVRVTEMATITPPYGINVFVIKGVAKDVSIMTIYRGVVPFIIADLAHIALLIFVPQISLFLPSLIK
ncbi:MAG: TRAP transporter large permease subunit [Deltaproteobacteria bacterium]|nr:TRAP transporter large permease subunit [Deltaproteobacteria bacterium]